MAWTAQSGVAPSGSGTETVTVYAHNPTTSRTATMASKKPFSKVAGSAYKQAAGLAVGAILASQIKSMTRNLLPGIPGRLLAAAVPGAAGVFLISQKSETGQNIGLGMVTSSATELATLGIEVVTGQTSLTGGSDAGDGTVKASFDPSTASRYTSSPVVTYSSAAAQ